MNILLLNNGYPSVLNPQYSTYIKTIKECLELAGYNVVLLTLDTNFKGKINKVRNYLKFYYSLFLLRGYQKYDFVFIHNYPFVFLPLILSIKRLNNLVIHWHGTDVLPIGRFGKILNKVSYWFLPSRFVSICPSEYFKKEVLKKFSIRGDVFVSASGGVDTEEFKPNENLCSGARVITLGYCSSLIKEKGADLVLELSKRLGVLSEQVGYPIIIEVINYGAEKEYFSKQFNNKSVRIRTPFPKEEMKSFYQGIDVLLFPSKRRAESLGLVGLEAMSCGIPVVGTNDFALKEYIIPGETGEVFKLGDYDDFEAAIIRAIKNIDKYNPRDLVVKKYSKDAVVEQYKEIFR